MLNKIHDAFALVSTVANYTPVLTSRTLNELTQSQIYVKCENFQRGGAFKFRGAFNAISNLSEDAKNKGVVTHSSGNHAQAVALVGRILGIKTTIVMPNNAPEVKVSATKGYGAEVVFSEPDIHSREKACDELIKNNDYSLIHPYDNEMIIAGAATASVELIKEVGELDLIIAPVGGGGLISGTSLYSKLSGKIKRVIAAEPEKANDAYQSFTSGKLVRSHSPATIADGLRTLLSERTFGYIQKHVDEIVTVSEEQIIGAMQFFWERMKIVVEPSGAVSLAVLLKLSNSNKLEFAQKIGIIISGGNIDLTDFFNLYSNQI
ncbi:MAG: L-threonine dehydratase catabolic TdcB [Candidatus Heimdallarchaeota archaeon LC_2]|nr:MAG: L-threonine dehydratase catabolic TdcB [Candidatus Heimdallarchaeota archaeon LC_2]